MNTSKTKSELRAVLFQHLDGITTVPVAYSLYKKGILDYFLEIKQTTLSELTQKYNANEGYLNVALRVLASQGWLIQTINEVSNEVTFSVSEKSEVAFELVKNYEDVFNLMQFSEKFHPRKFEIEPFELLNSYFRKYKKNMR